MLTVCFDWESVVHHECAPPGQTINKEYYLNVLHQLRDVIQRKRPQLWATASWQLRCDSVPAHAPSLMQSFSVKHQITQVTQLHPAAARFGALKLLAFPKTKIPFEREEISDHQ